MEYTTLEQAKELVELGLDPSTADMHYGNFCAKGLGYCDQFHAGLTPYTKEVEVYESNKKAYGIDKYKGYVAWEVHPCWSADALLHLLPKFFERGWYQLEIFPLAVTDLNSWAVRYYSKEKDDSSLYFANEKLIDSAVDMMKYLINNKKISINPQN